MSADVGVYHVEIAYVVGGTDGDVAQCDTGSSHTREPFLSPPSTVDTTSKLVHTDGGGAERRLGGSTSHDGLRHPLRLGVAGADSDALVAVGSLPEGGLGLVRWV